MHFLTKYFLIVIIPLVAFSCQYEFSACHLSLSPDEVERIETVSMQLLVDCNQKVRHVSERKEIVQILNRFGLRSKKSVEYFNAIYLIIISKNTNSISYNFSKSIDVFGDNIYESLDFSDGIVNEGDEIDYALEILCEKNYSPRITGVTIRITSM